MDFDALPISALGTAIRVYSYGMLRAVNFGMNTRFVMFDVQRIGGKYCRVPNLVLDVPTSSIVRAMMITEALARDGHKAQVGFEIAN